MKYTDLHGETKDARVWCHGPLYGTVWALTDSGYIVVHASKMTEVEYEMPVRPSWRPTQAQTVWAESVLKHRYANPMPDGSIICDPERDVAAGVWNLSIKHDKFDLAVRKSHRATSPIATKRILDMLKEDDQ